MCIVMYVGVYIVGWFVLVVVEFSGCGYFCIRQELLCILPYRFFGLFDEIWRGIC